jgi:hypothetical protein
MNTSLVNINFVGLAQPATALIERVFEVVGGITKPWQIRRVAKAEAETKIIHAETDAKVAFINTQAEIGISEIQRRGLQCMIREEGKNQENIENITLQAIPHLNEDSKPEDLSEDWLRYFFESARLVSYEDIQTVWGKILAEEANTPKSFSKKTLNLMSSLDKADAHLFTDLCRFACEPPRGKPRGISLGQAALAPCLPALAAGCSVQSPTYLFLPCLQHVRLTISHPLPNTPSANTQTSASLTVHCST